MDDIIAEYRRLEQAKSHRIYKTFVRLPNTAATSSCEDLLLRSREVTPTDPPETLTRVIRRELEAMSPAPLQAQCSDDPSIYAIQAVVRQELVQKNRYKRKLMYTQGTILRRIMGEMTAGIGNECLGLWGKLGWKTS